MATDNLVMIGDSLEPGERVEEALDRLAAESPYSMTGDAEGEEDGIGRGQMVAMVRYLVELSLKDPAAFRLLGMKMIDPDMTHEKLAAMLKATGAIAGAGRVRSYEVWKRLTEEHPELAEVVSFDRRGGNQRGGAVHPADLDREYRYLVEVEGAKPRGERRKCYGEEGLYAEVARTCRVHGRDGKPSWLAARQRIMRFRREKRVTAQ